MRPRRRPLAIVGALAMAAAAWLHAAAQPDPWLGQPRSIRPGVDYFTTADRTLAEPNAEMAAYLLRLDPSKAKLDSVLSNDEVYGAETVDAIAARHRAVAAVNGG